MELISSALADAGDVHTVDAGAVLGEVQRRPDADAVALARSSGRHGSSTAPSSRRVGRLRLQAALRIADTRAVVARGEGEVADETGLFRLVDEVVRQIVTSSRPIPGPGSRAPPHARCCRSPR